MIARETSSLRCSILFHGIDLGKIGHYTGRFITNMYRVRSSLFEQGDPARYLYVVDSGRIKLTRLTEDGQEFLVGFLGAGELVGEDVLFGSTVLRNMTARCVEDSVVCAIRADEIRDLVDSSPRIAMNIARHFALQRDAALASVDDIAGLQVSKRLVRVLHRLAAKYGTDSERGRMIDVRLTHAEMATLVGSTRETVSVELSNLVRSGQLGVSGRHFFLPRLHSVRSGPAARSGL